MLRQVLSEQPLDPLLVEDTVDIVVLVLLLALEGQTGLDIGVVVVPFDLDVTDWHGLLLAVVVGTALEYLLDEFVPLDPVDVIERPLGLEHQLGRSVFAPHVYEEDEVAQLDHIGQHVAHHLEVELFCLLVLSTSHFLVEVVVFDVLHDVDCLQYVLVAGHQASSVLFVSREGLAQQQGTFLAQSLAYQLQLELHLHLLGITVFASLQTLRDLVQLSEDVVRHGGQGEPLL